MPQPPSSNRSLATSPTLVPAEDNPLVSAVLHKRYKRFLADCEIDGVMQVVFCPNTGPMTGLLDHLPCPAKLSVSDKPGRKYRYTLEWMQPNPGSTTWVGVHSARANHYVAAMLNHGLLQPLLGLPTHVEVRREVPYGARSRVDFVLQQPHCSTYVEVKSVTMTQQQQQDDGGDAHVATVAVFPDTVSTRAQQHARELTALVNAPGTGEDGVQQGKRRRVEATTRAVMLFVVQRDDAQAFEPCRAKDPEYAALCEAAAAAGVKLVAVAVRLDEQGGVAWVGQLTVFHQGESLTSS